MFVNRNFNSFIFTHIPKCGGTSFREYLGNSAMNSGVEEYELHIPGFSPTEPNTNISQLSEAQLENLRHRELKVLADHSYFNVHLNQRLNVSKPFYFTLLREPVSRFVSHYNFFYYVNGYDNLKGVKLNDLSDEVLHSILKDEVCNTMTSYLCNKSTPAMAVDYPLFLQAIYNLERHVACFGILEDMDRSLEMLLQYKPHWLQLNAEVPKRNVNRQNTDDLAPNAKVIDIISRANSFDVLLYDFAKRLFYMRYDFYIAKKNN